ncbi:hypothetical protein CPB85DRAFT_1565549 [Mucidula mucida]|nr:hypothetical protein CPB85DRAFT_1565549 [Mucidula mucida]
MSPTSRLWKTYEDEAGKYDLERVADWRDGLDILLVFAALFSAVVTTFVSQTCQNLQVDYAEVTRPSCSNHSMSSMPSSTHSEPHCTGIPPVPVSPFAFQSKPLDLWVNALWFTSLGLSLTTTLIAVLAKQWIHQYLSIPSGTPLNRSRIHITDSSIVLQALSSLPLELIPVVGDPTAGIKHILTAISSSHSVDLPRDINERLQRAAIRFCGYETISSNAYSFHRIDPLSSIKAIEHNLRDSMQDSPSWPRCDVLLWGKLFENALRLGIGWLGISHDVASQSWCTLLRHVAFDHFCTLSDCSVDDSSPRPELYTFWMLPTTDWPKLAVNSYDIGTNGTTTSLSIALSENMHPSFIKWLLHVGFPRFKRSTEDYTENLPDDIFLVLAMLQTPAIQHSSSLHAAWFGDRHESLFRLVLKVVRRYSINLLVNGKHRDANIDVATILALQKVVKSDVFVQKDIILSEDKDSILEILLHGVTRRVDLYGSQSHDFSWLTPDVGECILQVLFASASAMDISEILVDICHYLLSSLPYAPWNLATLKTIYSTLIERQWLEGITTTLTLALDDPQSSITDNDGSRDPLHIWTTRLTSFQVSFYIDGLTVLEVNAPDLFKLAVSNLCQATNLSTMCKMLLMGDIDAQARLWKLAALVNLSVDEWDPSFSDFCIFANSPATLQTYFDTIHWGSRGIGWKEPVFLVSQEIPAVAARFVQDVRRAHFTPPNYQGTEVKIKVSDSDSVPHEILLMTETL